MSKVRITATEGKKLRDTLTGNLYSEVICDDRKRDRYVLADSEDDPTVEVLDGVTLKDRVADLEDAVIGIARSEKIAVSLKSKATVEAKEAKK